MTAAADHEWVSARAVAWVIHDAPVPADLAFTLTVIAARCDESGRGSRQSTATIAALTGKSPKQAQRDVVRLRELGLVVLGDQSLVDHLPPGQRPTVYDVPLHVRGPKPVKESRNKAGGKRAPDTPPMDGTPPFHGTPGTDAGGEDRVFAGGSHDGGMTPPLDGRGPMGGGSTPPMEGTPTPPIHGDQITLMNNPLKNPSLSSLTELSERAGDDERERDQSGTEQPQPTAADAAAAELVGKVTAATGATQEEARAVIRRVQARHHPGDLDRYMATMAQRGDLARVLAELRAEHRPPAAGPPPVDEYRASLAAACPHGVPGGQAVCALCRRGALAGQAGPVEVVPAEQARAAARAALTARARASPG